MMAWWNKVNNKQKMTTWFSYAAELPATQPPGILFRYENIRRWQQQPSQAFTADVPAKLNSSQLRRLADAEACEACDGCCCQRLMFSYGNSIPGRTGGYVAGSSAAYRRTRLLQ